MTAPTITPLYDIELESLLDGDVVCWREKCGSPAVGVLVFSCCGASSLPSCAKCLVGARERGRRCAPFLCRKCHQTVRPADIRIRPI